MEKLMSKRLFQQTAFVICSKRAEAADIERVGNQVWRNSCRKGAPALNQTSRAFEAISSTGSALGTAIVTRRWGRLELDLLHVSRAKRGRGIGTALMLNVEEFAKAKKLTAIRLNSATWQGVGFYERLGYLEMGRIPINPDKRGIPQFEVTYFKILTHR